MVKTILESLNAGYFYLFISKDRCYPLSMDMFIHAPFYLPGKHAALRKNRPVLGEALVQWLMLPAWKVRDRGFETRSDIQAMFLPRSLVKIPYRGKPLWPRGSVLGRRPPELELYIMCLEGSMITYLL